MRDGTAEPVSQDQILRREQRGQGNIHFPVQLTTNRVANLTRLILITLDIYATIHGLLDRAKEPNTTVGSAIYRRRI